MSISIENIIDLFGLKKRRIELVKNYIERSRAEMKSRVELATD